MLRGAPVVSDPAVMVSGIRKMSVPGGAWAASGAARSASRAAANFIGRSSPRNAGGSLAGPGAPALFGGSDGELVLPADQRHPEQERLLGHPLDPALRGIQGAGQPELRKAAGAPVEQRRRAELPGKPVQFALGGGPLQQVHEMDLDPPLGKEPERGSRIGALADAENLDLQRLQLRGSVARSEERRVGKSGDAGGVCVMKNKKTFDCIRFMHHLWMYTR